MEKVYEYEKTKEICILDYYPNKLQEFMELTQVFPEHVIRHCSNSAAIHRFPEMSLDMVRAGISLY